MEVSGQLQAPAASPPGKKTWYPLGRKLGGPQSRLDAVVKRKIHSSPTIEPVAQRFTTEITRLHGVILKVVKNVNIKIIL
jgi:hypothetical protein